MLARLELAFAMFVLALETLFPTPAIAAPTPTEPISPRPTLPCDKGCDWGGCAKGCDCGCEVGEVEKPEEVVGDNSAGSLMSVPGGAGVGGVAVDVDRGGTLASISGLLPVASLEGSATMGGGVSRESISPISSIAPPSMSVRSWRVPDVGNGPMFPGESPGDVERDLGVRGGAAVDLLDCADPGTDAV